MHTEWRSGIPILSLDIICTRARLCAKYYLFKKRKLPFRALSLEGKAALNRVDGSMTGHDRKGARCYVSTKGQAANCQGREQRCVRGGC